MLLMTQTLWAKPFAAPNAPGPSATTVNYQGHLADPDGNPLDSTYAMEFAIYDDSTGGNLIWGPEEHGTIQVSDGLFSVGLGNETIGGIPTSVWNGDRYLEITIDNEVLSPRELIRSVPIAGMALTVPDGAIGASQIADGAVNTAKIADSAVGANQIADRSIGTGQIADGAITDAKLAQPVSRIIMLDRCTTLFDISNPSAEEWHDVDISGKIPDTAKSVIVQIVADSTDGGFARVHVGPGGEHQMDYLSLTTSGSWHLTQGIVKVINGNISYLVTSTRVERVIIKLVGYIE